MQDFAAFTGQTRYDPAPRPQGLMSLTTTEEGAAATARDGRAPALDRRRRHRAARRRRGPRALPVPRRRSAARPAYVCRTGCWTSASSRSGCCRARGSYADCRVTGFDVRDALTAVHTDRGTISTRACVIACGPMSGVVARLAGIELPIQSFLRHKVLMPDVPQVPQWAPLTFDEDTGAHWRPALQRRVRADLRRRPGARPSAVDDPARRGRLRRPGARPVEPDLGRAALAVLARGVGARRARPGPCSAGSTPSRPTIAR